MTEQVDRWPRLTAVCRDHGNPAGLSRLLEDGAWLYTPAFLDSGERALETLDATENLEADVRTFTRDLIRHVAEQTKPANCLAAMVELVAAAWLVERGVLSSHGGACGRPASNLIDLQASIVGRRVGIEVKSDFDAFEAEIMEGAFWGDPRALGPQLRARFGEDVRIQFRWIGERLPREEWGPIRSRVRDEISDKIPDAPPLPEQGEMIFTARFGRRIDGCDGVQVVAKRGPLVHASVEFAGSGWRQLADRIVGHATHKASLTKEPFILLYISQAPQPASIDAHRMAKAKEFFAGTQGQLPSAVLGVIHLHLISHEESAARACGFLTKAAPFTPEEFRDTFGLLALPAAGGSQLLGRVCITFPSR